MGDDAYFDNLPEDYWVDIDKRNNQGSRRQNLQTLQKCRDEGHQTYEKQVLTNRGRKGYVASNFEEINEDCGFACDGKFFEVKVNIGNLVSSYKTNFWGRNA
jgi:hypothetical protein